MPNFNRDKANLNMVMQQIRPWDVIDQKILDVIYSVPRDAFVPKQYSKLAFSDLAIPLGNGEFMMKPNIEARALQALNINNQDHILEIGTGSGYITACLAKMTNNIVVSIDCVKEFTELAYEKLAKHNIKHVILKTANISNGLNNLTYDVIIVTGSVRVISNFWYSSLKIGGRLFIVIGNFPIMEAILVTRVSTNNWLKESLFETVLPPLRDTNFRQDFDLDA